MRKAAAAVALCFVAGPALAASGKDDASITAQLNAQSYAAAVAAATATAQGGQGGAASATGQGGAASATGEGGSVHIRTRRQAPAIGGLPSGPCTGVSGGVTTPFGGLIVGATDQQCTLRNNILVVKEFDPALAREMINDLDGVAAARARMARPSPAN